MPFHFSNRTEQNFYWFEIHIYKGLLPKQHIKYKELFGKEVKKSLADYQYLRTRQTTYFILTGIIQSLYSNSLRPLHRETIVD